jgi:phosphoribosylformylglycinamidine (FGAM) synthase PurS component
VRDSSDLESVEGKIKGISGAQALTPIGIAVTACKEQSNSVFVNVEVNGINVQIFSLNQPTVSDALLTAEIDLNMLKGKPGLGLTCTVNGKLKTVKGGMGSPGKIDLNGNSAQLKDKLTSGDIINFKPGIKGADASAIIDDIIPENLNETDIVVNGTTLKIKPKIYQNGKLVYGDTSLSDGAEIEYYKPKTVREAVAQVLEISNETLANEVIEYTLNGKDKFIPISDYLIWGDGKLVNPNKPLKEGIELKVKEKEHKGKTIENVIHEKGSDLLEITFNGSQLAIPGLKREYTCNGEKVDLEYEIRDGDIITYEPQLLTVNRVLEYINYNISASVKKEMDLTINGNEAGYHDRINDGDKVSIFLKSRQKNKGDITGSL